MNFFIFFIFTLINTNLVKIHEEIQEKFDGNNGWKIRIGQAKIQTCNSQVIFGGFRNNTIISKVIILPKHSQIRLSLDIWTSDPLGKVQLYLDQNEIELVQSNNKCKEDSSVIRQTTVQSNHNANSIIIVMSGVGDQNENQWGFRNLILFINECPSLCQVCDYGDLQEQCKRWIGIQNSWTAKHTNFMGLDGWTSISGISGSTNCGGVPLIGGYNKFGRSGGLTKIIKLQPHYQLKLQVLWAKIDSWDNEQGLILFDGKIVWSQNFTLSDGYRIKVCGNAEPNYLTRFQRVDLTVNHVGDQVAIAFWSSLDQNADDESFGLRDFQLFYAPCFDDCDICTGPLEGDCKKCSDNKFLVDKQQCQINAQFQLLQSNFYLDKFTSMEGWTLSKTKSNTIITNCQGKSLLGGSGVMGVGGSAQKQFFFPPHSKLRFQITIFLIDSWENEKIIIEIDKKLIWSEKKFYVRDINICGNDKLDQTIYIDSIIDHDYQHPTIRISSSLEDDDNDKSWGFRDFALMHDNTDIINNFDRILIFTILLIAIVF